MFSHDDPSIIWIGPGAGGTGRGSRDDPYGDVSEAIGRARPGDTVVFIAGRYTTDVTIQNSGTVDHPIRVTSETEGCAEFVGACWYLYDVSDLIITGLVFKNTPHAAISAVGACERNCFRSLRFIACGTAKEGSSTMFFGGSGGRCNVVDTCIFDAREPSDTAAIHTPAHSIGILITEGDGEHEGMTNRDHIFRRNIFRNYGCGILVGSRGTGERQYGHVIEHNEIRDCAADGIRVRCGDTILRGNVIERCGGNAISLIQGMSSVVTDNRIEHCGVGIRVQGTGHTLSNNCIVGCRVQAIHVACGGEEGTEPAGNCIIEHNTMLQGADTGGGAFLGIRVDPGTSCVIQGNLFSGRGHAYTGRDGGQGGAISLFADENLITDGCGAAAGCRREQVAFADANAGDYENSSGAGARGWMMRGQIIETGAGEETGPDGEGPAEGGECEEEQAAGNRRNELLGRSFFFGFDDSNDDDGLDDEL